MFKFEVLSELKSFKARALYCNEYLTYIDSGSSRRVYDMGNGNVLKLASNSKGISQNEVESDYGMGMIYPDEVNGPVDNCEHNYWVTAKRLEPVDRQEIADFYGVSWSDLSKYLDSLNRTILSRGAFSCREMPESKDESKRDRLRGLSRFFIDFDVLPGDLMQPSAFGKDSDTGAIKLVDSGCTREVYLQHYQQKNNRLSYGGFGMAG